MLVNRKGTRTRPITDIEHTRAFAPNHHFGANRSDTSVSNVPVPNASRLDTKGGPLTDIECAPGLIDGRITAPAPKETAMIAGIVRNINRAVGRVDRRD